MTKDEAQAELVRLNKIAEAIQPEFLRLQNALGIIGEKMEYCQSIIDGKEAKTRDEMISVIEAEFALEEPTEGKNAPANPTPAA